MSNLSFMEKIFKEADEKAAEEYLKKNAEQPRKDAMEKARQSGDAMAVLKSLRTA